MIINVVKISLFMKLISWVALKAKCTVKAYESNPNMFVT